jgi:zinc protease
MFRSFALSLALLSTAALAQPATPTPLSQLTRAVTIPYETFTLPNGLRVIVSTDRKAPVVAVSVWYDVGSKHEPAGKTGFAHLFEHLMFNGSENAPGDFFEPLQRIGATDVNGTTWFDRTNYFETVPTPALERALWLESDRMGHLLGAVTEKNLRNQIGVVQNEKRQGDNQPFGLVEYAQLKALLPPDHPYGHSTIGSMADLDAASLEDVKNWFRQHYGPNNAVIALAGDVDVATARRLVEKYFGHIPRGPQQRELNVPVPAPAKRVEEVMKDRVATTRIYRTWTVPGLNDPDAIPLDIAASVLGGLSSSRLDNALVRGDKSAVRVSAGIQQFAQLGFFEVQMDVSPGLDVQEQAAKLDKLIADFVANGPTADEVLRAATQDVAGRTAALESVGGYGGKAPTLAEGALYSNDPGFYKKQLAAYASATPERVKAAMQKWLTRPMHALTVVPGPRGAYEESQSVEKPATFAPAYYQHPGTQRPARTPPEVGEIKDLDFPDVQRAKLSNGIELVYAQRTATPTTRIVVSFDAGNAADPADKQGVQSLTLALLNEGTRTRNSIQLAEQQERLGANIGFGGSTDRTNANLFALSPNLKPSVELLADMLRNPAFAPAEVERLRPATAGADRLGDDAARRPRPAHPAAAPVRPGPSLWPATVRHRRRGRRRKAHPRRPGRLPPRLAAAGQGHHLRRLRSAARRGACGARRSAGRLAGGGRAGAQGVRPTDPRAHAQDRAGRPAGFAPVAHLCRPGDAAQRPGRDDPVHRGQRRAGRQLPVAPEHGPQGVARLVLRRLGPVPPHAGGRALSDPGARPGRQDGREPGRHD